ncbi:ER degradation-enhancing alpha-mannosidase-like protein 3 [Perkinsus olseni]|uniref:ER degradation-enhancing alpha-mannosidase-like protein 3 n=1 Tax=Perkinsus olseni TaxID=32597 RepID=A0A7J6LUJ4_PEROL|nr:ER degradation-enhancing alpha-mannosidase-like protein 3 [Perkinsus olseni]
MFLRTILGWSAGRLPGGGGGRMKMIVVCLGRGVHWASVVDEEEGVVVDSKVAVMWQETAKLVLASTLFCMESGGTLAALLAQVKGHPNLLLLNMIPAALYCIYNVLTYHGLKRFAPGTYFVLLQSRIVMTALLYQLLGSAKKTSLLQWVGLIFIMLGSMLQEGPALYALLFGGSSGGHSVVDYMTVFLQAFLSSAAGIFSEKLLRNRGVNPHIQNVFMYADSLLLLILSCFVAPHHQTRWDALIQPLTRPWTAAAVINAAFTGILTGFVLRSLGSIIKSIAAAVELWATALASSILFGYPLAPCSMVGMIFVSVGFRREGEEERIVSLFAPCDVFKSATIVELPARLLTETSNSHFKDLQL